MILYDIKQPLRNCCGTECDENIRKGGGCFASGLIFMNESWTNPLVREGKLKYY